MGFNAATQIDGRLRNHDWRRTIAEGVELAKGQIRSDVTMDETHVMWALLCEAAEVSKIAYSGPPRTGMPSKSALPEAPDDVTQWQRISAYLRGEVEELPEIEARAPRPSAEQVTRSEIILEVWHRFCINRFGERSKMKKAVYLKACGMPDRKVRTVTGMTKQRIHSAKKEAMQDMWEIIRKY
ncbi:hypothetical protein [Ruegeria sp. HKCCA4812]|uniref:hypothetical protein n=1 Tax=Ruegeria sp. HKCCA4812 TaxID=2682993 RepID=UPI001489EC13|nr:hypothetical protein [Ruegeria sp. HKCCA4812]